MSDLPVESVREVRAHLADVVDRADRDAEPTIISRRGREVAAVVPIEVLRLFRQYEEQAVIAMIRERMASPEPGIPMEQVMAEVLKDSE